MDVNPQEASIRIGDVFALLVEHKHALGDLDQAWALLGKMRDHGLVVAPYVDARVLEETQRAMGATTATATDGSVG